MFVSKPFCGDFGWELMRWQAHCRHISRRHDKSIIYCMEGCEYFYQDFATEIVTVKVTGGTPDCWSRDGSIIEWPERATQDFKPEEGKEIIEPSKNECAKVNIKQDFIPFGERQENNHIVIHARNTHHKIRNWPMEKWQRLLSILEVCARPLEFYSIGTKTDAIHIPGTYDFRDKPIKELVNLLAAATVCIGPSSGPMHLASLCRCPHIVWTDRKIWRVGNKKATNNERYTTLWNPLNTPCKVLDDGWNPEVDSVFTRTMSFWQRNTNQ